MNKCSECKALDDSWNWSRDFGDRFDKEKARGEWYDHRKLHKLREELNHYKAKLVRLEAMIEDQANTIAAWRLANPPPDPNNLIDWCHHWRAGTFQEAIWNWWCDYGEWPQARELWGRLAVTEYSTLDYARRETERALEENYVYGIHTVVARRRGEVPGDWTGELPAGDNGFRVAVHERHHAELRRNRQYEEDMQARMRRIAA